MLFRNGTNETHLHTASGPCLGERASECCSAFGSCFPFNVLVNEWAVNESTGKRGRRGEPGLSPAVREATSLASWSFGEGSDRFL